jgi:hypothetical protein
MPDLTSGIGRPLQVAVLATPETGTAGTFIVMDLLASVGQLWQTLHGEAPGARRFEPRLLSADGKPYRDYHNVLIEPHGAITDPPGTRHHHHSRARDAALAGAAAIVERRYRLDPRRLSPWRAGGFAVLGLGAARRDGPAGGAGGDVALGLL